jgi:hypothetical protein
MAILGLSQTQRMLKPNESVGYFSPVKQYSLFHSYITFTQYLQGTDREEALFGKLLDIKLSIHPSMSLQPLPDLGVPHKTPPFISIRCSYLPSSYPQQL